MKTKFILIIVFQFILSGFAFPAAFIIMIVFDIESHSKFISASDGSTGPAFYALLKIWGILLVLIWLAYPVFKLMKYYFKKKDFSGKAEDMPK